jgi:hypothetical protein
MRLTSRFVLSFLVCCAPSVTLVTNNANKELLWHCRSSRLRPGHDDAIAIVLALASPELDVKAVTASAGNQTPDKTLRNVLHADAAERRIFRWPAARVSR